MRVLVARSDSAGDVLLAEPAIRAVAASADVDLLVSYQGKAAAELIPHVRSILVHQLPWIAADAHPVNAHALDQLIAEIKDGNYDQAIILTSFHQSALPLALLMRLAGVPWIAARSEDYPGSLLDLRFRGDDDVHEVLRSLRLVEACGYSNPVDLHLRITQSSTFLLPEEYVVLHPGGTSESRRWSAEHWRDLARSLAAKYNVLVTGSAEEKNLTQYVAGGWARSLGGETTFEDLALIISKARALVSGNTSAVHLASATGTPVIDLFSPVVPFQRWGPWMVPHLLLGDQQAPCAGTRARECPLSGHPCLNSVSPEEVFESALYLIGES